MALTLAGYAGVARLHVLNAAPGIDHIKKTRRASFQRSVYKSSLPDRCRSLSQPVVALASNTIVSSIPAMQRARV